MKLHSYLRHRADAEAVIVAEKDRVTAQLQEAEADAERKRPLIEKATSVLDDKTASEVVELYPTLTEDGALVKSGTRINWNGVLKRAAADLWDTTENNPDNAPVLWEDILYRDGYRVIPEIVTAGLTFTLGEKGWWGDVLYESTLDANTYTPEQYPDGWKIVENG